MRKVLIGLASVVLCAVKSIDTFSQENNAPLVKIINPSNNGKYDQDSQVHYRVKVSDKEDGESEYNEIATNEVFLEVRYVSDVSKISSIVSADPNGLTAIKKSNCFNCHAFNGKLIAPSFYQIAKRYPPTTANMELLTKRIREGSGGVWGTASMPSHIELSNDQGSEIVSWILKNADDPNLNYYTGIEGTIKLKVPSGTNEKGAFMLTATYSDHGTKNDSKKSLLAKDVIAVFVK